jgi:hypothetical protein
MVEERFAPCRVKRGRGKLSDWSLGFREGEADQTFVVHRAGYVFGHVSVVILALFCSHLHPLVFPDQA